MAEKTLGYVELEWTCPNCGSKNPGQQKSCGKCGSPQPENVQFEAGSSQALIQDAGKAASAAKGPDIHCPYCHTRNPADAQVCVQCGGDLKEGLRRESGRLIGVEPPKPPASSATGKPARESSFRPWMLLPVAGLLMLICVIIGFLFFRTATLYGTVQNTQWQREIAIQEQRQVTHEDWRDQVPAGGTILSCQQQSRSQQANPAPGAKEVCATKLVDQGNGAAKVEESCYYEIYADYCKYNALEWQTVNQLQATGTDLNPGWPAETLAAGQREGGRTETYTAFFQTKDGIRQYSTDNPGLYAQFQPGSEWLLSVNALGAVLDVSQP